MPLQKIDPRTARYDHLSGGVVVNTRSCVVEIAVEALELLRRRKLTPEEAVRIVAVEEKLISRLATALPPDDGKIHITAALLASGGEYPQDKGN